MPDIEVANIVAVLDFHRELDLEAVTNLLEHVDEVEKVNYSPEENHWLQTWFKFHSVTKYVAFYRSGTCAIVGCNSRDQVNELVDIILTAMEPVIREKPTLQMKNFVCVGKLNQEIDLTHLAIAAGLEKVEYEPEQFPGLIYRNPTTDAVFLVFASGKVVITGTTSLEDANTSFAELVDQLEQWGIHI